MYKLLFVSDQVIDPSEVFQEWRNILRPRHKKVRRFLPKSLKEAFVKGRYLEDATANVLKSHGIHFIREQFIEYKGVTGQIDFIITMPRWRIIETKYVKSGKFNDLWLVQTMVYALGARVSEVMILYGNDAGFNVVDVSFNPRIARMFVRELVKAAKPAKRISAGDLIGYHTLKSPKIGISVVRRMLHARLKDGLVHHLDG